MQMIQVVDYLPILNFNLLSRQLRKFEILNDVQLVHFEMNSREEKFVVYLQASLRNNFYFLKQLMILSKYFIAYYFIILDNEIIIWIYSQIIVHTKIGNEQ